MAGGGIYERIHGAKAPCDIGIVPCDIGIAPRNICWHCARCVSRLVTSSCIIHAMQPTFAFLNLTPAQRMAQFWATLQPPTREQVQWVCAWADQRGWNGYVVGGFVRDLVLQYSPGDLDVVIEGDAIAVAQALAEHTGGSVHAHPQFGTATVEWGAGSGDQGSGIGDRHGVGNDAPPFNALDFITARREWYPQPAALPQVAPAALPDDLARRDFTINTLALALNGAHAGQLFTVENGLADLADKLIRVLHDQSFMDDPTRILRAIRFAARLGFGLEPHTGGLLHAALEQGMLARTTPARIRHELRLLLEEDCAAIAVRLLHEWGILAALHPALAWTDSLHDQFKATFDLDLPRTARRTVLLLLLLARLSPAERHTLASHYNFPKAERDQLGQWAQLATLHDQLDRATLNDGALDALLAPFADEPLHAFAIAHGGSIAQRINRYRTMVRPIASRITGHDLLAQGIPPGPAYRRILAEARAKQLDEDQGLGIRDQGSGARG